MNNIVLFATYWNEIEWIKSSLDQILKIDPIEIIICDGNFDPSTPNYSTDGTREIIEKFVKDNSERARMIDAVRTNKFGRGIRFYKEAGYKFDKIKPSRLKYALASQFKFNEYRVNQAITFAKMMNMSKLWKVNTWAMTYDADQFYSESVIENFGIVNESTKYQLLTANEFTFPDNFDHFTEDYELRKWNNMPFKIQMNMAVYPTRHFVVENYFQYNHLHEFNFQKFVGEYYHYKFRNNTLRLDAGYSLGDRKAPNKNRFKNLKKYYGKHPSSITNNYKYFKEFCSDQHYL